ncbi:hypothetical protein [Staphylococcus hominis]|uniref:hypothetical protein n=1 Tax=Staphylococcus hominis TaxID=1290 RepID=UPI00119FE5FC|nr:hypothetical protein [Staphylococcus hominis]
MAKIKRKVEMTLPELIEWGFKNNIRNREFVCDQASYKSVIFNLNGWSEFSGEYSYLPQDTFSVEIEEKITEETVLPELVELSKDGGGAQWSQKSIDVVKNSFSKEFWLKDGDTMTLIWKDGELVGDE